MPGGGMKRADTGLGEDEATAAARVSERGGKCTRLRGRNGLTLTKP